MDLEGARHDQAVSLLTGLERFIRLVVQRETGVGPGQSATPGKASPKVYGAPRPYTGLYSAGSYMANRPTYTGYKRPQISSPVSTRGPISTSTLTRVEAPTIEAAASSANTCSPAAPSEVNHASVSDAASSNPETQIPRLTNEDFQALIPEHFIKGEQAPSTDQKEQSAQTPNINLSINHPISSHPPMGFDLPPPPTKLGTVKEMITKSTLTETTVTRVTDNQLANDPFVTEVSRSGFV